MKSKLEQYIAFAGKEDAPWNELEYWPIEPSKMLAYYAYDFLIDFYSRYKELRKKGWDKNKIFQLFPNSSYLKCFLINFACINLETFKKTEELLNYIEDRDDFCSDLIEMIEIEDPNFMKESRSLKIKKIDSEIMSALKEKFIKTDSENEGVIGRIKVAPFGYNWSIYGDLFAVFAYFSYGKISVKYMGEKLSLNIYKYDFQKPSIVWPKSKKCPYERIDFYILARPNENVGVRYILVRLDGKTLKTIKDYTQLIKKLAGLTVEQSRYVDSLNELQKIDKMILLTYYSYRKFLGDDWKKMCNKARKNIKTQGPKLLKKDNSKLMTHFWNK